MASTFVSVKNKKGIQMKKAMKLFTGILVTLLAVQLNASRPSLSVNVIGDMKIRVEASEIKGRAISFIKNEEGKTVYSNRIEKVSDFALSYDLSELKEGKYVLEIVDEVKSRSVPFIVSNDGVEVLMDKQKKVFFPEIVKKEESVMVKFLSNDTNDLRINIRSKSGELLLNDKLEGQLGLIGKTFEFTPGEYSITLASESFNETRYLSFK